MNNQLNNSALNYFNQANKFFENGKYKEALNHYDKAIRIAPNFTNAYQKKRLAQKALERYGNQSKNKEFSMTLYVPLFCFICALVAMSVMFFQS